MAQLRVLIVGASIAGPTAAYWFARAGADVTVIERFSYLRQGGQNVDIRTIGVTVMRKMRGMEAAVRDKALPLEGISFVSADGRPYGIIKATGSPDQQSLVSEYEIFRGDLAQILFDMTRENERITYIFGEQIHSMREEGDGPVTVEFSNTHQTATYDLVVACDGANSRTRAMGLGCGVRDHVTSINSWAAYFSVQGDLLEGSKVGQAYSAVGGRFIAVGPDPSGVSRVTLMGINARDAHDSILPFREAVQKGETELKKFVAQQFKGAGWKCDEIVQGMMKAQDFYAAEIVQVKAPCLYRGRFAMVGDAGYAPGPTGAGTSLAIAGAYVLAGEISDHGGDLEAGLRAYQERMRPLIRDLQKIPPLVPDILAPQTAWGIRLRDAIFAFICRTRIMEISQRFFVNSFADAGKYDVPEYQWLESK